ncbi:MAG: cation transporter [Actinobacteria bacterium HGW-Actinobacteria-5]|jgi:divalent metal cation (Fe/Co/Zn/Cd) transporter|nr:MAG: cation transporter [Actinobacteria bacterium HGW-Actinobacteria-5]
MSGASSPVLSEPEIGLTRRGLRLAWFTIGYNVVEGVVAVTAGAIAGLVSLVGFGIDSGIESISAVLVAMRLWARLRHGTVDEAKERRALRLVAITFFLLAGYVIVAGIRDLAVGDVPDTSIIGIVVLAASLVVMPLLAAAKRRVGMALGGDPLILADAAETRICVWLSVSTLAGLVLFQLTGAAWLDPVAGFVIAAFAIHEGIEAWHGELVETGDDDD